MSKRTHCGIIFFFLVAMGGAACFKPAITDGGFQCAVGSRPCPDGFQCDRSLDLCKRHPSDGGAAGKGGSGAGVGGVSGTGGTGGQLPCFEPKQSCDPSDAGTCDPYCQSGCAGCREKCSVNTAGALTCNVPTKTTFAGLLRACAIDNKGLPDQTDDCEPGHVCIDTDVCFARCFRFCRSDQDCDNAFCDRTIAGGRTVCSVPVVDTCSPLMVPGNTGCGIGMACYLSATHAEHTFCDCPGGNGTEGADCSRSRDCNPGLACAYVPTRGKSICQQVCELTRGGAECVNGGNCRQYSGASGAAAPHPLWGFCY